MLRMCAAGGMALSSVRGMVEEIWGAWPWKESATSEGSEMEVSVESKEMVLKVVSSGAAIWEDTRPSRRAREWSTKS